MLPAYVTAIFFLLATALVSVVSALGQRTESMRADRIRLEQTRIGEALEAYRAERGTFPATLDELTTTVGYEHIRTYRNEWQRYARSGNLSDGTWQFQRAATWSVFRRDGASSYQQENECGSGPVTTASSWCGSKDGIWHRTESREFFAGEIAQEKLRQRRTLQLFADGWTASQAFPNVGKSGVVLVSGQMGKLADLVGYSGSATNCQGVHSWVGIPFDCSALFDYWGNPTGYQYQSADFILLTAEAPFASAAGTRVIVASPLNIQE